MIQLIGNRGICVTELDKMNLVFDSEAYVVMLVLENGTEITLHEFFDEVCDILFDTCKDSNISYISKFFAEILTKAQFGDNCVYLDEIQAEVFPDEEEEDDGETEKQTENQKSTDNPENRLSSEKTKFGVIKGWFE